jgi:hypothetical protein
MTSTADVMNFIVANRAPNLDAEAVADIFARLVWILEDNGGELASVRCDWLEGDDVVKVEIALLIEDVYPYKEREKMQAVFQRIAERWPRLGAPCRKIMDAWDRDVERKLKQD